MDTLIINYIDNIKQKIVPIQENILKIINIEENNKDEILDKLKIINESIEVILKLEKNSRKNIFSLSRN